MNGDYVLRGKHCDECVFDKFGDYNDICIHCPDKFYSKRIDSNFLTEEYAKSLCNVFQREEADKR